MRNNVGRIWSVALLIPFVFLGSVGFSRPANAQNQELQERVAEMKEAVAKNKQAMTQYTWVEQINISVKGEQKKQEHFQVRLGPDGKPQKASLDPPAEPTESGGRLKRHIVEKKKEEYKEYAEQMKALAQQYVPPDRELLQQAYAQGNITLGSVAGAPGELQLVIHNYLKPQDSMTLVFDKTQKELLRLQIASYMDDPKDAMNLTVQFSRLPEGPNHVSSMVIDGVSKQLNIATQNSNYQHL
ncbi:MAG: hypothetical protein WB607_01700 [Candidatus Acidiferrum sp.]|jgi:hypothetical protein